MSGNSGSQQQNDLLDAVVGGQSGSQQQNVRFDAVVGGRSGSQQQGALFDGVVGGNAGSQLQDEAYNALPTPPSRNSAIFAGAAVASRLRAPSAVFSGPANALRSRAPSAIFAGAARALRLRGGSAVFSGTTDSIPRPPALGPGVDGPIEAINQPLGAGVDANVNFVDGTSLGPGVDAEVIYDLILYYGAPTNGRFMFTEPVRSFGGLTGDVAFLAPPANHFGGTVEGVAQLGPAFAYGGTTAGEVAFIGIPPPTNLVATPVNVGKIALTWNDVSNKESGFRIERSPNGQGLWSAIGTVPANTTIFIDTDATPLVVFDYRVIGFNAIDESIPSNVARAFSPAPGQPVPPPSPAVAPRILEFLSPGVYGLERNPDGNTGGNKV